jgi:hypothetical protein
MLVAALSAAIQGAAAATVGLFVGGVPGALAAGAAGLAIALPLATSLSYPRGPRGAGLFAADHTWSLPNTICGSVFLLRQRTRGHRVDKEATHLSGRVFMVEESLRGYATAIGPVIAGATESTRAHEELHVRQARLFGPFYVPLVLANYVLFTIAPVWLLYHDHQRFPIRGAASYLTNGVYRHVWHEEWAYRRT